MVAKKVTTHHPMVDIYWNVVPRCLVHHRITWNFNLYIKMIFFSNTRNESHCFHRHRICGQYCSFVFRPPLMDLYLTRSFVSYVRQHPLYVYPYRIFKNFILFNAHIFFPINVQRALKQYQRYIVKGIMAWYVPW